VLGAHALGLFGWCDWSKKCRQVIVAIRSSGLCVSLGELCKDSSFSLLAIRLLTGESLEEEVGWKL
jgi:hypothetical protein